MELSKIELGYTFHGETMELLGLHQDDVSAKSDTCFFAVELKICNKYEIHPFPNLQTTLEYSLAHNLVYRFIEYTNKEAKRRIYVIYNVPFTNRLIGYQNFYGIGCDWKLYVNSEEDIVVQHMQFPKVNITTRFSNFPTGPSFYLNLSRLIYILTNYKLKTEKDIKEAFLQITECTGK